MEAATDVLIWLGKGVLALLLAVLGYSLKKADDRIDQLEAEFDMFRTQAAMKADLARSELETRRTMDVMRAERDAGEHRLIALMSDLKTDLRGIRERLDKVVDRK